MTPLGRPGPLGLDHLDIGIGFQGSDNPVNAHRPERHRLVGFVIPTVYGRITQQEKGRQLGFEGDHRELENLRILGGCIFTHRGLHPAFKTVLPSCGVILGQQHLVEFPLGKGILQPLGYRNIHRSGKFIPVFSKLKGIGNSCRKSKIGLRPAVGLHDITSFGLFKDIAFGS